MAAPRPVSYPLATWTAPVVPTLSLLGLLALGSGLDEPRGFGLGLATSTAILLVGLGAWLVLPGRHLRGLGLGLATGAGVTCLCWLAVLVS